MTDAIHLSIGDDGVLVLTLDRRGRSMNVIDQAFIDELSAAIDRIVGDPAVRGAVITSGKAAFLAGGDLFGIESGLYANEGRRAAELVDEIHSLSRVLRRLETCGRPIACAFNGLALGGGLELGLACHRRLAADDRAVQFGLPEVQVGLMPAGGGTTRLPRLLGIQAALPYLLEGRQVDAAAALAAGIIHEVVPHEALLSRARTWVLENPDAAAPWDRKGFAVPGGAGALSPAVSQTLVVGNAMSQSGTMHNYPAPLAILSCVYEGTQLPIDKALRLEAKYMARLMVDPVTRNLLRTLFVSKSKADKLVRRPEGVPRAAPERIGILGAGLMGAGIAFTAAQRGLEVVLLDRSAELAARGRDYARKRLESAVGKGRMDRAAADRVLSRIHPTSDYADLAGCGLVVEAVFEDRAVKAEVTRRAEAVLADTAILATNTSTLPITGLAEASERPGQFIGLHFFSPVERMPLVEVIRGRRTSDVTLARALDFVQAMRKTPIVVNDSRGFYTSRIFGAYVNEGVAMVGEGVHPALVENVARIAGMPVGALAVSDEVGLDLACSVAEQSARDLGASYEPGKSLAVISRLVEDFGRHGRKNGRGFYDYLEDGSRRLWPGLRELFAPAAVQPEPAAVRRRMLYAPLVDAAKCIAEGVITDPADGDLGAVLGVGFPPYLGGPFSMMDMIGLPRLVAECEALAQAHGKAFVLPALVREMARAGETFYGPRGAQQPWH